MDFMQRCAIGYGGISVCVPFLWLLIRQSGTDTPQNLAWVLLSFLMKPLVASWIVLALGYFGRNWWIAAEKDAADRVKRFNDHQEAERIFKEGVEEHEKWTERKISKLTNLCQELREEIAKLRNRLDDAEKPKEEPFAVPDVDFEPEEGSISLALEEFG